MMKEAQSSSRQCFVCGVENPFGLHIHFYDTGPAEVTAEYTVPEHFQGYGGIVHGGVIAAMLDEVASRVYFRGDPPRLVVTAKLNIRYRNPVPVLNPIRLVGRGVEDKGRVCTALGQIWGADGTLLAEADVTLVEVPVEFLEEYAPLDTQGWKVYPEESSQEAEHDR